MTFRVGQKVERFEGGDDPKPVGVAPWWLLVGAKCVVSGVIASRRWPGEFSISLVGYPRWHRAKRFRPIVERKTDISVFTAMLTEEKIGASA